MMLESKNPEALSNELIVTKKPGERIHRALK